MKQHVADALQVIGALGLILTAWLVSPGWALLVASIVSLAAGLVMDMER